MDARKSLGLYTPQFGGTSKKICQRPFSNRLNEGDDSRSSVFSSINSSLDQIPQLESKRNSDVNAQLQKQRKLAENTLKRASEKFTYGNTFKTPIKEDSTVNESDLMKVSGISNFNVQVSSTPRASTRDSLDVNAKQVSVETRRPSETFDELIYKLKTSDITISEVCREFREKMGRHSITNFEELDSNYFMPAEMAVDKIKADEMSWRREKDIPVEHLTDFTQSSESSFKNKVSMGEFFQQRSEDISELIPNGSPEKTRDPIPLVENSIVPERERNQSLSISEIAHLLSEMNNENPSKVISYLLKQKKSASDKENVSPNRSPTSLKRSISPTCSTMQTPSLNSTAKSTVISMASAETESSIPHRTQQDKSICSSRSGSALSRLPDGKLPIETTHTQLVWGCVKLGKSLTQEFAIRNRSQHRMRIMLSSNTMEFKLLKDKNESEAVSALKILLRPLETRTLAVTFCPSAKRAFAGVLNFTPLDSDLHQSKRQMIVMFGYGGHASIEMFNSLAKDPTGKFLLTLGDLTNKTTITKTIICRNSGDLPGFVYASFEPKSVCSFVSISIVPNKFIVKPKQEISINVTYTATKEDVKYFQSTASTDILEIGVIKLYYGAEALRGRLKYLMSKARGNGLQVKSIVEELSSKFIDEDIPNDIGKLYKESVHAMKQLLQEIFPKEIVVTVEHDPDATIVPIDDTSLFQTLCQDSSNYTISDPQ